MKLVKYFTLSIIVLIINSCASYSLKGTIPVHIKNIYISPIINKSMDQEVVDLLEISFKTIFFLYEKIFL